jgi:hypothetical protein
MQDNLKVEAPRLESITAHHIRDEATKYALVWWQNESYKMLNKNEGCML